VTAGRARPHGELRIYPGTHFDLYEDPEVRARALHHQIDFLQASSPRSADRFVGSRGTASPPAGLMQRRARR
jgi:hypothetical protein